MLPSDAEIEDAAAILARLQPGFLPPAVFQQLARLSVVSILELVPLRVNSERGTIEVFLLARDDSDPVWPGMLHTPGSVIRPTDVGNGLEAVLQRLFATELAIEPVPMHFVTTILHDSGRGAESAQIYWAELTETPQAGSYYPVDALPESFIASQHDFLGLAVAAYDEAKRAA